MQKITFSDFTLIFSDKCLVKLSKMCSQTKLLTFLIDSGIQDAAGIMLAKSCIALSLTPPKEKEIIYMRKK